MSRSFSLRIVSLIVLFSMVLVACAPAATPTKAPEPTKPAATAAPTSKYSEAPILADQVKAGKLPEVTKRLPDNPLVVTNGAEIGTYGGTWRMGLRGGTDDASFIRMFAYEPLLRWSVNWDKVEPGIAEKWSVSADAKEYTITLRKGLKWSDGAPFTADDIMFWYTDIVLNKELSPTPPSWLKAGADLGVVTKVDDVTIKFTFNSPYGLFEQYLAHVDARTMMCFPKHWASQFHPTYTDKAKLEETAKANGFTGWVQQFNGKVGNTPDCGGSGKYSVAGRPTMDAWMVEQPYSGNATQVTFVRNPYYWKVDPKGNQLPYIDKLTYTVFQDVPAMLLKATNGEIDMQMRHFNTLDNKAVLFDNQAKGGYHFFETTATLSNVGPGLNKVGAVDNYAWMSPAAKWLLIFDMLAGRLELYTVFVLMVPDFWRK